MRIRTVEYFIREAFISLKRNGLMTIASISTVAVSLLILGLFLTIILNLNHMASTLESKVEITAYLQDGLSEKDSRAIGTQISQMEGVADCVYISKEKAMERFQERLGDQKSILAALDGANPLPSSFEIRMDSPGQVRAAAAAISRIKGVETAKFGQEVIDQLFKLTHMIRLFGLLVIVFLALATLFIISNTIRLTVFARRKEIGIMKYVGATDWFIRWPFLLEGMIMGFVGSVAAVVVLRNTYSAMVHQVYASLAFIPLIPQYPFLDHITAVMLAAGTLIGALGSTISLKRFMRV